MIPSFRRALYGAVLMAVPALVSAAEPSLDEVRATIQAKLPGIQAEDIRKTPIPGIYELSKGSEVLYISGDGRYLFQGDLLDMNTGAEITEARRRHLRAAAINALGEDMVIEYPPPPPYPTRHMITVWTDIDCGYCRKMHRQLSEYHKLGIGIRYLFFPRSGPNTPSFSKAVNVYCSEDRQSALTRAKQGQNVTAPKCDNTVLQQYRMGLELGARGTPFVILPDGEVVNGYLPPAALAARLDAKPRQDPVAGGR